MAPKDLIVDGAKFVPNNYAPILNKAEAPSDLHFVQDFLANSEIGYALTQPQAISSQQVLTFWRTGHFDNGGAIGTPSIVFEVNDIEHVVTPEQFIKLSTFQKAVFFPQWRTLFYSSSWPVWAMRKVWASLDSWKGQISERNGAFSLIVSLRHSPIDAPTLMLFLSWVSKSGMPLFIKLILILQVLYYVL